MAEGVAARRLTHPPDKIQIKEIFPRLAAQGPGLDLGEIQIAQREGAEGAEQSARNVAHRKYHRSLPLRVLFRPREQPPGVPGPAQGEEAGEILAVVFDLAPQKSRAVNLGGNG